MVQARQDTILKYSQLQRAEQDTASYDFQVQPLNCQVAELLRLVFRKVRLFNSYLTLCTLQ